LACDRIDSSERKTERQTAKLLADTFPGITRGRCAVQSFQSEAVFRLE
jgi:hypothetical protein